MLVHSETPRLRRLRPPSSSLSSFSFLMKPRLRNRKASSRRARAVEFDRACNFRSLARSRVPIRIAFGFYAAREDCRRVSRISIRADSDRAAICGRAIRACGKASIALRGRRLRFSPARTERGASRVRATSMLGSLGRRTRRASDVIFNERL